MKQEREEGKQEDPTLHPELMLLILPMVMTWGAECKLATAAGIVSYLCFVFYFLMRLPRSVIWLGGIFLCQLSYTHVPYTYFDLITACIYSFKHNEVYSKCIE